MMKRITIFSLLLVLVFWFYPLLAIILAGVLGFFYYPRYYEIIVLGVIADIVYQTIIPFFFFNIPCYTFIALLLFVLIHGASKRMNVYA